MPSFSDSIFLFVLALLLFGPKKLPMLARELGKWVGEFRRASNEFKMQMEDELRQSEQQERQKQIAAMEAAAPVAPQPIPHPHLPETTEPSAVVEAPSEAAAAEPAEPLPIATVGELKMMPPSTGLPLARNGARADDPLGGGLLDSIPSQPEPAHAGAAAGAEGESGG